MFVSGEKTKERIHDGSLILSLRALRREPSRKPPIAHEKTSLDRIVFMDRQTEIVAFGGCATLTT